MILKIHGPMRIENLRHYSGEMVDRLHSLLAAGACARPDPRRKNFYDLDDGDRTFFIHISPTGTVLLLATWLSENAPLAPLPETAVVAVACSG